MHNNLAVLLMAEGRLPEAEQELRAELAINPRYAAAHDNLARVLAALGRAEEAAQERAIAEALASAAPDCALNSAAEGTGPQMLKSIVFDRREVIARGGIERTVVEHLAGDDRVDPVAGTEDLRAAGDRRVLQAEAAGQALGQSLGVKQGRSIVSHCSA